MKLRRTAAVLLTLMFLLQSSIVPSSAQRSVDEAYPVYLPFISSGSSLPPIIPETTKPLSAETTEHLLSVSAQGNVFTFGQVTPELADLKVGDVMVSAGSAMAPYGFLRRVLSIAHTGGQVIVTTDMATLDEAIEQGDFFISKKFTPADIRGADMLEGVSLLQATTANLQDSFFFELNNVVLYDKDNNLNTTHDQWKANGTVELRPQADFRWSKEANKEGNFEFIIALDQNGELEFVTEVAAEIKPRVEIARLNLGTTLVLVGPVPVLTVFQLPIYVGIDGKLSVGVTTSITLETKLTLGARRVNGNISRAQSHFYGHA